MMRRLTILMVLLCASTAGAQEPCRPHSREARAEYARVDEYLATLEISRPRTLPGVMPEQQVWLTDATGGGSTARITSALQRLTPGIRRVAAEMGASAARPVQVIVTDIVPAGETMAQTQCWSEDEPLYDGPDGEVWVPGTACQITVFTRALTLDADLDFALAHEWMHVLQNSAYGTNQCGASWWREGSADWFAHEVMPGYTGRSEVVDHYLSRVSTRSLNDMTYEASVFLFWGAKRFGAPWVFELGQGRDEYLASVEGTAQVMGPDHWQAYAEAVADGTITYPDGRPIRALEPTSGALEPVTRVEGPPLSVQYRRLSPDASHEGALTVTVDAAGGLVSTRAAMLSAGPPEAWARADGAGATRTLGTTCAAPSALDAVAIRAAQTPLRASLRTDPGEVTDCAGCFLGRWMELTAERGGTAVSETEYHYPAIEGVVQKRRYAAAGPIYTFAADGTWTRDDPRTATHHEGSANGPVFLTTELTEFRESGTWTLHDSGHLVMVQTRFSESGTLTQRLGGVTAPISTVRTRRGRPVAFRFTCEGDAMFVNVALAPPGTPPRRFVRVP